MQYIRRRADLQTFLDAGDLTAFFRLWSSCLEDGLRLAAPGVCDEQGAQRGNPRYVNGPPPWATAFQIQPDAPGDEAT
eukprot:12306905-Alexandrium_andersonii.AAC.1